MNMKSYVNSNNLNFDNLNIKQSNVSENKISDYVQNNYTNSAVNNTETVDLDIMGSVRTGFNLATSLIGNALATRSIIRNKVIAGTYDTLEKIGDGGLNLLLSSFTAPTVDQLIYGDLTSDVEKKRITDWLKEDISINYVDGIENEIYNNTTYGSNLNNNSFIKWNSSLAELTESISHFVTDAVSAAAASFASGGVASPLVLGLGYMEGSGEAAEKAYQKSFEDSNATMVGIVLSGISGSIKWWALARSVQGASELINTIRTKPTTTSSLGSDSYQEAARVLHDTRRHRGTRKFWNRVLMTAFTDPENLFDMASGVSEILSSSLNNTGAITTSTCKSSLGSISKDLAINMSVAIALGYVGTLRTPLPTSIDAKIINLGKIIPDMAGDMEDAGLFEINNGKEE